MKFALSTEQSDFARSLGDLLAGSKTPDIVRSWARGDLDPGRALLRQLADAGVTGLIVDESYDGLGASPVDLVVAFIELGRAAVPGPLVETAAFLPALLQRLDYRDLAAQWLPRLATGAALGSVAVHPLTPRALDADIADLVLYADMTTVRRADISDRRTSVDAARRLFDISASDVVADDAADAVSAAVDHAVLACAAQLLGAGLKMLEISTDYAKNRVQFGRPIGQFQAIKHHLADALVAVEMARPLLYGAATALSTDSPTSARDVSAAKVACGDAAYLVARKALQVHGAIGYTAEYDLSLWLTKVRALQSAWGTAEFHRTRIATALRGTA
ncbi:acyl-CoA dehydrogenase [Skermania sp. ID1734]|uniref:acyl-CoA dehydrogenase family protein n=1 Tax=Skermania sp. ID1734 TaxID=2597516 RepID=UPI00117D2D45|nr:acyl-CoA dehydrogenase family protein [Skermania sp. ID1734]TSD95679.1 acyl-CoA dehydrogenase [Skermania sp. ID1734]